MLSGIVRVVLGRFGLDGRTKRLISAVSFLILMMLAGLFVFSTLSLLWNEAEELGGVLTRLATMAETMDIPAARDVWRLPYFYDAAGTNLRESSTEKSTEDWANMHKHAVQQEKLQPVCLGPSSPCPSLSWLDDTFGAIQSTQYGISYTFTPVEAKTIYFVNREPHRNFSFSQLPIIKLWFARDANEAMYILSHIKSTTKPDKLALRLKVHFSQSKEVFGAREFRIKREKDETLSIEGPFDDLFVAKPTGTGWGSESDWYFKLVLPLSKESPDELSQIDAVELLVSTPQYQIGTRGPIPLEGYIDTYATARNLFHMASHYELYLRFPSYVNEYEISEIAYRYYHLFGILDPSIDSNTDKTWRAWLLKPLYRLYFFFADIKACPNGRALETTLCYRDTGEIHRLRMGKDVVNTSGLDERKQGTINVRVFTERDLVISWNTEVATLSVVVVLILGFMVFLSNVGRLRALRQSEQINEGLKSYDHTFIHQAGRYLTELEIQTAYLAEDTNSDSRTQRLGIIRRIMSHIRRSLVESTSLFDKKDTVRGKIDRHSQRARFDVAKSIEFYVAGAKDTYGTMQIEFCNNAWQVNSGRLLISYTGPTEDSEDDNFVEALQVLIENANQHGNPDKKITVSLDVEKELGLLGLTYKTYAVIRVSNYGPKIPKELLQRMFLLGERYEHGDQDTGRSDIYIRSAHHGKGLFLMSQIVEAYGGDYRMDNFDGPDGTGVVVTFRLPAELKRVTGQRR